MAKRQLDQFDLEAERGSAVRSTVVRSAWGKGTIKSRRGRKDAKQPLNAVR